MRRHRKNMKYRYLAAAAAGVAYGLAFPLAGWAPLAWVTVAGLIACCWDLGAAASFRTGFVYGLAAFGTLLYWVDHSVRIYGGLPLPLSVATVALLAAYLALYTGVFAALFSHLYRSSRLPALVLAPLLWVSLDLARTYLFSGFPWGALGYSQYRVLPLIQVADLTGVYGVTFLVVAVNGLVADLLLFAPRMRTLPLFPLFPTLSGIAALVALLAAVLAYGRFRLAEEPAAAPLRVSLIQGNIDQARKWDAAERRYILATYYSLTRRALADGPDLVVWPESALPFVFGRDPGRTGELRDFVRDGGVPLLAGAMTPAGGTEGGARLANAAVLIGPDGTTSAEYRKIHLVPFGEYTPLGLPIGRLVPAIGDFERGRDHTVMKAGGVPFSVLICYEIIFPELVRKFAARGARLLVSITNDAWFGRTAAPYQHFSMAVFRAVENRVPVARAANTGISGFIDSRGRILDASRLFREEVRSAELRPGSGRRSFYTRFGNVFGYVCVVASILLILFKGEMKKWQSSR